MKILVTLLLMTITIATLSCVSDRNFELPKKDCESFLTANTTYRKVKNMFVEKTFQIQDDLIIEGYVISSDESGNFFSVLHFQDSPVNPTEGFQIEIDLRDSHLFYPVGSKIFIKLKGLYLGKSKEVFKIGGAFSSFGNISVGRLPASAVREHVFLSCDEKIDIEPAKISIEDLNRNYSNTLVQFDSVQINEEDINAPFAIQAEVTERVLVDCNKNEIALINSGFSDFYNEVVPEENGKIKGVLIREKDDYQLQIRTLNDIEFGNKRCADMVVRRTSNELFISEIADPDNRADARFLELYNSGSESIVLNGWRLLRYTNANTEVSSEIDLSGFTIASNSAFVISPNSMAFEDVYGFLPDWDVGKNSPADSNGDDNLVLIDPFNRVVDIFGVIGEDGSGTNHEFEDGRAVRNVKIKQGNSKYTTSEWRIFNDTGSAETINAPQNAPQDFSPGIRN